jgi:hypothetical protein
VPPTSSRVVVVEVEVVEAAADEEDEEAELEDSSSRHGSAVCIIRSVDAAAFLFCFHRLVFSEKGRAGKKETEEKKMKKEKKNSLTLRVDSDRPCRHSRLFFLLLPFHWRHQRDLARPHIPPFQLEPGEPRHQLEAVQVLGPQPGPRGAPGPDRVDPQGRVGYRGEGGGVAEDLAPALAVGAVDGDERVLRGWWRRRGGGHRFLKVEVEKRKEKKNRPRS